MKTVFSVAAACGALAVAASGAIRPIASFAPERVDTFDSVPVVPSAQSLSIFDGVCTVRNLTSGGAMKTEHASTFSGDTVRPITGIMIGQIGISEWTFLSGQRRFGGMFENNSGKDGGVIEFYDAVGALIGTAPLDCPSKPDGWRWNGWESDVAFTTMRIKGNGIFNGFLWFENMQISSVPGPGAVGFGAWMICVATRSRRRSGAGA